jgi:uncharacterized membrane protein
VCVGVTETQGEGTSIPEGVAIEGVIPGAGVLGGATSTPEAPIAPEATKEVHDGALPESSMDVVVRSREIQDAEPIHSTPMSGAAATNRDELQLLADDLVDPATVARNLESMRHAEQWMKVRSSTLSSRTPQG